MKTPSVLFSLRYFLPGQPTEIRIHRAIMMKWYGSYPMGLGLIAAPINWFRWLFRDARRVVNLYWGYCAQPTREEHRISEKTQRHQLLKLALIDGIHPASYYKLELFKREKYANRYSSLFPEEAFAFQRATNKPFSVSAQKRRIINNKQLFNDFIGRRNLPVVPILRAYPGDIERSKPLPREDLFLKPRDGVGGLGADWLVFDSETGKYHSKQSERIFSATRLELHCEGLSEQQPLILQPCLRNHAELERMIGRTLATLRVHTCYDSESCSGTVISIALKAPLPGAVTDNGTNSLFFAVERQTGEIGEGIQLFNPLAPRSPIAPATGQPIAGAKLPDHSRVVEICKQAHAGFPEFCILGWDVALTPDGPLLLETNIGWSIEPCELVNETQLFSTDAVNQVKKALNIT